MGHPRVVLALDPGQSSGIARIILRDAPPIVRPTRREPKSRWKADILAATVTSEEGLAYAMSWFQDDPISHIIVEAMPQPDDMAIMWSQQMGMQISLLFPGVPIQFFRPAMWKPWAKTAGDLHQIVNRLGGTVYSQIYYRPVAKGPEPVMPSKMPDVHGKDALMLAWYAITFAGAGDAATEGED